MSIKGSLAVGLMATIVVVGSAQHAAAHGSSQAQPSTNSGRCFVRVPVVEALNTTSRPGDRQLVWYRPRLVPQKYQGGRWVYDSSQKIINGSWVYTYVGEENSNSYPIRSNAFRRTSDRKRVGGHSLNIRSGVLYRVESQVYWKQGSRYVHTHGGVSSSPGGCYENWNWVG